jgi:hypothetical protein
MMWVKWKLISVSMEIVLISMQDTTVCSERAIGSKIVLSHPMDLVGDLGQVEALFSLLGEDVNLDTK